MVVAEMNTGAILGRALAFPLTLIALYFWKRSKAVPDEPVEPVPTPQPTSGGKMSSGLSSHGPDGVVANFRIECPVLGCNEVFSTKAAADVWLEEHKQRCPFHAGALPETRVPGEPITAWDAWNCSKWRSRWWWSEGTREWQLIEQEWRTCEEEHPEGWPPRKFLVNRLSGVECLITPGGMPGASKRDPA